MAGNLAWNLIGESLPVLAAVIAIPVLLHRLGADRFGVLTLSWMIAGYFGLFDFGLGQALTKTMAQEFSVGCGIKAATLFWTTLAMMLALGVLAGVTLAMLSPWLTRSALKIPAALRRETLAGFYVIALGLPLLICTSGLRAALIAADRFDLLNVIRTPSGILSFAVPVLMLPFTHNLAWLIGALMVNRAVFFAIYFSATLGAVANLRFHFCFDRNCASTLLGFGAWISVSSLITPLMVYLDRLVIGASLSMAALTAYSVPMEIISKSFILPAAVSGVMFPAFARSIAVAPEALPALFGRSLKLLAVVLCPVCAAMITFAPQIMSLWIGGRFAVQSAAVFRILALGAFATGLSWIPLVLLHGAHRPDLAAKIHLVDFPPYALIMWIMVRTFGLSGAAFTWSGRLLLENVVIFAMATRFMVVSRREIWRAAASLISALALIAIGAMIPDVRAKVIFVCALSSLTGIVGWRFLLTDRERVRVLGCIPRLNLALGKAAD